MSYGLVQDCGIPIANAPKFIYTKIARHFVCLFMRDEERWEKTFCEGMDKHLLDWIHNIYYDGNIIRLCPYSDS